VESTGHDGSAEFVGNDLPLSGRHLWVPLSRFIELADGPVHETHLYRADTGELDGLRSDLFGIDHCETVC
jgi:hypothetical protein